MIMMHNYFSMQCGSLKILFYFYFFLNICNIIKCFFLQIVLAPRLLPILVVSFLFMFCLYTTSQFHEMHFFKSDGKFWYSCQYKSSCLYCVEIKNRINYNTSIFTKIFVGLGSEFVYVLSILLIKQNYANRNFWQTNPNANQ